MVDEKVDKIPDLDRQSLSSEKGKRAIQELLGIEPERLRLTVAAEGQARRFNISWENNSGLILHCKFHHETGNVDVIQAQRKLKDGRQITLQAELDEHGDMTTWGTYLEFESLLARGSDLSTYWVQEPEVGRLSLREYPNLDLTKEFSVVKDLPPILSNFGLDISGEELGSMSLLDLAKKALLPSTVDSPASK